MLRFFVVLLSVTWFNFAQANVSEWIAFELKDGKLTVPVEINKIKGTAVLDSTAQANFLGLGYASEHGSNLRKASVVTIRDNRGERRVERYTQVPVELFGSAMNFRELTPLDAGGADLILGVPFFRQYIIQIDYPNNKLRLVSHSALRMRQLANVDMRTQRDPITPSYMLDKNDPSLKVLRTEIAGQSLWLTFDSSLDAGISLQQETAERLGLLANKTESATGAELFSVNSVKLGPYELDGVLLAVNRPSESTARGIRVTTGTRVEQNVESSGAVGYDLLRHFILTLDYRNNYAALHVPE